MTVLLGMTVYLLLIAGFVPETSDEVPLLGIFFIVTIAEMTLAVIATVVVLKVHYGRWKPCGNGRRKSKKTREPTDRSAVNPDTPIEDNDNSLEMISYHSELPARASKDEGNNESCDEEEKGRQAKAAKLDQIFFCFFLIVVIVSAIVVYRLTNVD